MSHNDLHMRITYFSSETNLSSFPHNPIENPDTQTWKAETHWTWKLQRSNGPNPSQSHLNQQAPSMTRNRQVQNGDPNHSVHLRWGDEIFVPKIVEAPKKHAQNCKPIKNQLRETMERIFDREEKRSSSSGRKEMIDNFQSLERELVASF